MYSVSITIAILSNVLYHLFQKSIASGINPLVSLVVTYATGIVTSLILLPFFPQPASFAECLKPSIWPSVALGVAVVGLEIGFLLAYRAGWAIGEAAVVSNVAVALILVPIGVAAFKESITPANLLGVLLCIGGLILIRR